MAEIGLLQRAARAGRAGAAGPAGRGQGSARCGSPTTTTLERQPGPQPVRVVVIGGIAATTSLKVTTGVTCPTTRIHPAILAQAAATAALMLPAGRFLFGVGTGENLNEHVLGDRWPRVDIRLAMLEEAVEVMRKLWRAG